MWDSLPPNGNFSTQPEPCRGSVYKEESKEWSPVCVGFIGAIPFPLPGGNWEYEGEAVGELGAGKEGVVRGD